MLYQGGWSAVASVLALVRHRPKMPDLGFDPRSISTKLLDVLASESTVALPCPYSYRWGLPSKTIWDGRRRPARLGLCSTCIRMASPDVNH